MEKRVLASVGLMLLLAARDRPLPAVVVATAGARPTEPAMEPAVPSPARVGVETRSHGEPPTTSQLSPMVRAQISATLGRDRAAYHATPDGRVFRVENGRHDLAVEFSAAGVDISSGGSSWRLAMKGYGYGDHMIPTNAVLPHAAANRIEYRRGALVEWYANGPIGLEQGFTLAEPPVVLSPEGLRPSDSPARSLDRRFAGSLRSRGSLPALARPSGNPLTVAFLLSGMWTTAGETSRSALVLARPDGSTALRYGQLVAFDATGRELRSWLELDDRTLKLRVDDAGAVYPLQIDPVVQAAKLSASDAADADVFGVEFGVSVAISGDTIVVGARGDDIGTASTNWNRGSAYVFAKPAEGWNSAFTESAKLIASDGAGDSGGSGDFFGTAVAVDGDTIVVGAPGHDYGFFGARLNRGAAYVFVKPALGWSGVRTENAKLIDLDDDADSDENDFFGESVAISGDTIVVGARLDDVAGKDNQGSASVFVRGGGGWSGLISPNAKLLASDGAAGNGLGASVAIHGDTIVAGAPGAVIGTNVNQGAAYVFVRNPDGGWSGFPREVAKLTASDGGPGHVFGDFSPFAGASGHSIAVAEHTVVVGARASFGGISNRGAVYVFLEPETGWFGPQTEQAKLIASDGASQDLFGASVATNGAIVVVGAPTDNVGAVFDQGSAYYFVEPEGGWSGVLTETEKVLAGDGANTDVFGQAVAIEGSTFVVGAMLDDFGPVALNQGSAYVFSANQPPSADAGANQVIACVTAAATSVTLDATASSDPEGDALTYEWRDANGEIVGTAATVALSLPLGNYVFLLQVSDGKGGLADAAVFVHVVASIDGLLAPMAALVAEGEEPPLPDHALRAGRTVPLRMQMSCAAGSLTEADVAPPVLEAVVREGEAVLLQTIEADTSDLTDIGADFTFRGGSWTYNLGTRALEPGTYTVIIATPDFRLLHAAMVLR